MTEHTNTPSSSSIKRLNQIMLVMLLAFLALVYLSFAGVAHADVLASMVGIFFVLVAFIQNKKRREQDQAQGLSDAP